jgi:hypothetical protein
MQIPKMAYLNLQIKIGVNVFGLDILVLKNRSSKGI